MSTLRAGWLGNLRGTTLGPEAGPPGSGPLLHSPVSGPTEAKRRTRAKEGIQGSRATRVWYVLVAQLVSNGESQVEPVVFGQHAFPLGTAHASQVCDPCSENKTCSRQREGRWSTGVTAPAQAGVGTSGRGLPTDASTSWVFIQDHLPSNN